MLITAPYALLGLTTLVGLVAIYTFRARFRRRPVSSLMLWRQTQQPQHGGVRRDRLALPPLFWLELLLLLLLILAALNPHLRRSEHGTLFIVYDASASMQARNEAGETPQERAATLLERHLRQRHHLRQRLLLARASGAESVAALPSARLADYLRHYPSLDSSAALDTTLAHALALAGSSDEIMVLTDHAPPPEIVLRPGLIWHALGQPLPNRAVTLATRTWLGAGEEWLLVEAASYGFQEQSLPLRIVTGDGHLLYDAPLQLNASGRGTLRLNLPPATPELLVELPSDALALDNRALLLPEPPRPLNVALSFADQELYRVVSRALLATGRAHLDTTPTQLLFSDQPARAPHGVWHCRLVAPDAPVSGFGPWLADQTHPLLEGVSLSSLPWQTGTNQLPGRALLLAGSQPLLSLEKRIDGGQTLHLMSGSAHDALYRSPAWPALVWNLLQECAEAQPGPPRHNLKAGSVVRFTPPPGAREVVFETPTGRVEQSVRGGKVAWAPVQPGRYRMELAAGETAAFAVNFHAPAESDLRRAGSGTWHEPLSITQLQRTHRSLTWLLATAALLLALLHHGVIARVAGRRPNTHSER